jgi:hypothetical protein
MNETNRSLIVLLSGVLVMVMAVLIFLTWSANQDLIDALFDGVEYLEDHNDDPGRLIVTLGALIVAVAALLVIILELAPEDEVKELKVQQAGATTIVPAQALRERLEEALLALPEVTSARARVKTKDEGITAALELSVTQNANVAHVTQEASRVVIDTIQEDLGLPVKGSPVVRVSFGGVKPAPVASSWSEAPQAPPEPEAPPAPAPTAYSQYQRPPEPPAAHQPPPPPETPSSPPQAPPREGDEPGDRAPY